MEEPPRSPGSCPPGSAGRSGPSQTPDDRRINRVSDTPVGASRRLGFRRWSPALVSAGARPAGRDAWTPCARSPLRPAYFALPTRGGIRRGDAKRGRSAPTASLISIERGMHLSSSVDRRGPGSHFRDGARPAGCTWNAQGSITDSAARLTSTCAQPQTSLSAQHVHDRDGDSVGRVHRVPDGAPRFFMPEWASGTPCRTSRRERLEHGTNSMSTRFNPYSRGLPSMHAPSR